MRSAKALNSRATSLITNAQYIGRSQAIISRMQTDLQQLRIVAPMVVGDDLDPQLKTLTATLAKVRDRMDRLSIDNAKQLMKEKEVSP